MKIVSESRFSGKTYFYTIASRRSLKGKFTGSLSTISSGRSMASNISVQSDSGLRGQQRQRGRKRPSAAPAPGGAGRSSAFTSKVN